MQMSKRGKQVCVDRHEKMDISEVWVTRIFNGPPSFFLKQQQLCFNCHYTSYSASFVPISLSSFNYTCPCYKAEALQVMLIKHWFTLYSQENPLEEICFDIAGLGQSPFTDGSCVFSKEDSHCLIMMQYSSQSGYFIYKLISEVNIFRKSAFIIIIIILFICYIREENAVTEDIILYALPYLAACKHFYYFGSQNQIWGYQKDYLSICGFSLQNDWWHYG